MKPRLYLILGFFSGYFSLFVNDDWALWEDWMIFRVIVGLILFLSFFLLFIVGVGQVVSVLIRKLQWLLTL